MYLVISGYGYGPMAVVVFGSGHVDGGNVGYVGKVVGSVVLVCLVVAIVVVFGDSKGARVDSGDVGSVGEKL
ncbi:Hypothetical predicted protein [Olea europaea subsp. europaea]|uniref:Uncharacterized protein n=1 Tax=Olea europaea subsp. europaea TaxID=158383 RepID=A0A8S0VEM9_OLEEU|nr:Hypothetical predicted protein [Olea europaea subsp. europaea]